MSLGSRINEVRKSNNITQKDFAKELGISQAYVSRLEKDGENPSETLLLLISLRFAVNIEWLKMGVGEPQNFSGTTAYDIAIERIRHFSRKLENHLRNYNSDHISHTEATFVNMVIALTDPFTTDFMTSQHRDPSTIYLEHFYHISSYLMAIVNSSSETARHRRKNDYKALLENQEKCQRLKSKLDVEINNMVEDMLNSNKE